MKYAVHILTIKMWEWEGIKEKSLISISANGPNSFDCENLEAADRKILDIQEAINVINQRTGCTSE